MIYNQKMLGYSRNAEEGMKNRSGTVGNSFSDEERF